MTVRDMGVLIRVLFVLALTLVVRITRACYLRFRLWQLRRHRKC